MQVNMKVTNIVAKQKAPNICTQTWHNISVYSLWSSLHSTLYTELLFNYYCYWCDTEPHRK